MAPSSTASASPTMTLADLDLADHHSIRLRIGIEESAKHPGGINIFGRGFGNYDQDIVLGITVGG